MFGFEARRTNINLENDVFLIPLFGHTYGHCGVALKHESRWLLYVGGAYYWRISPIHSINQLEEMRAENNVLRIETLNKIRNLTSEYPDIEVFGYHDFEEYKNK